MIWIGFDDDSDTVNGLIEHGKILDPASIVSTYDILTIQDMTVSSNYIRNY
jgi:hypothetical protein